MQYDDYSVVSIQFFQNVQPCRAFDHAATLKCTITVSC